MKTKGKERIKDYNEWFSYLKNRIPTTILLVEELLAAYYIKGLPAQIAMWVKRARKESLQEDFSKSIQFEKDIFYFKENPNTSSEQASTSHKSIDNAPKPTTTQDPFNMSDMKKLLQKISNEMVDLKKTNNEKSI